MNQGWVCPKCGAVMAPWVSECVNCRGMQNAPGDPIPYQPFVIPVSPTIQPLPRPYIGDPVQPVPGTTWIRNQISLLGEFLC